MFDNSIAKGTQHCSNSELTLYQKCFISLIEQDTDFVRKSVRYLKADDPKNSATAKARLLLHINLYKGMRLRVHHSF
jgi:hypothetical protein